MKSYVTKTLLLFFAFWLAADYLMWQMPHDLDMRSTFFTFNAFALMATIAILLGERGYGGGA